MRSIDYARASRAMFCSVLLLSQHTVVDANAWVTGRSSRSSTLAVAAPGGRDRPIRDWKAMNRFGTDKRFYGIAWFPHEGMPEFLVNLDSPLPNRTPPTFPCPAFMKMRSGLGVELLVATSIVQRATSTRYTPL